jgi:hypothetical protein
VTIKDKLILFPLLVGIGPLVLAALGCRIMRLLGGGPHERRARTRLWPAEGVSAGMRWTAWSAVAIPEPRVRRWNGHYLNRDYWETMAALSDRVRDDIRCLLRCSDREVPMCQRFPPQTRQGRLDPPRLGPNSLN